MWGMGISIATVTVDCAAPGELARWWAEVLGWRITFEDAEEVVIEAPEGGAGTPLLFIKVPEGKTVKNRLHLDLRPDDRDAEVARVEALGGRRVDIWQGEPTWVVMADPEGNEFCILRALREDEK